MTSWMVGAPPRARRGPAWFACLLSLALPASCHGQSPRSAPPASPTPAPESPSPVPSKGSVSATATATALAGCSDPDVARAVGRMVMVGFRGTTLDAPLPIAGQIRSGEVGGVILYQNVAGTGTPMNIVSAPQLKALISGIRALASPAPLVALDEEGGQVDRLAALFGSTRSEAQLGAAGVDAAARQGEAIASRLKDLGITLNLAPDVDLSLVPGGFVERDGRSFSADPVVVTRLAHEEVAAHRRFQVLTTLKHFPGYGTVSSAVDAYRAPPDISSSWQPEELEPYRSLIAGGDADLVMVSSQVDRRLDPAGWPASLSPAIVGGVLRGQLGFQGIVIADDLQSGITNNPAYGLAAAVRQTLLAGVDILLFSNNNPEATYDPGIGPAASSLIARFAAQDPAICRNVRASLARLDALQSKLP